MKNRKGSVGAMHKAEKACQCHMCGEKLAIGRVIARDEDGVHCSSCWQMASKMVPLSAFGVRLEHEEEVPGDRG